MPIEQIQDAKDLDRAKKPVALPKKEKKEFSTTVKSLSDLNTDLITAPESEQNDNHESKSDVKISENIGNLSIANGEGVNITNAIRDFRDKSIENGQEINFSPEEDRIFSETIKKHGYDKFDDRGIPTIFNPDKGTKKKLDTSPPDDYEDSDKLKEINKTNKMEQAPKTPEQPEIVPPVEPNQEGTQTTIIPNVEYPEANLGKVQPIGEVVFMPTTEEAKIRVAESNLANSAREDEKKREQEFLLKVEEKKSTTEKGPIRTFTDAFKNLTERAPKAAEPSAVEIEKKVGGAEQVASSLSPLEKFSTKNQGLYSRMREGARNIANEFYDKVINFPAQKTFGKLGVVYNEFMANWNEKRAVKFKTKMDAIEIKKGVYDSTKKEMEDMIVQLKAQGLPGSEALQIKLRDIEDQKRKLDNKKDKAQSKFEKRDNKTKLWTEKRDGIADRLIGNYDEKLKPMEQKLEELKSCHDQLDLIESVAEVKHANETSRLDNIREKIEKIEHGLKLAGSSDREIRKIVGPLVEQVVTGTEKIKQAKAEFAKRRMEINLAIAKTDKRANPYRDNREQFVRIKDRRPIDMDVEKRGGNKVFDEKTKVEGGTRMVEESNSAEVSDDGQEQNPETTPTSENIETKPNVAIFVSKWNEYLKAKNVKEGVLNPAEFTKLTKLSDNFELKEDVFKKLLKNFLKFKKIPDTNLNGFTLKK